jgi:hypothetical protein
MRPDIRERSILGLTRGVFANEEESIYGHYNLAATNYVEANLKCPISG